jgi:hypothetical protein
MVEEIPMNPIERALALRQEADVVMQEIGLLDLLSQYGEVTFSGSYFLDVMAYPDIDLYLSRVDIWSLDDAIIEKQMRDMRRFKERITPQLREQIVAYKGSVLTSAHRTPMYSGYFIYKAFFDEGMTDFAQVTQYLVEQGIQMG